MKTLFICIRVIITGVLGAYAGFVAFAISAVAIFGLLGDQFNLFGGGDIPSNALLLVAVCACLVCFFVPFFISLLPIAHRGGATFVVAYILTALLASPLASGAASEEPGVVYFLGRAVYYAYFGGTLGDRIRGWWMRRYWKFSWLAPESATSAGEPLGLPIFHSQMPIPLHPKNYFKYGISKEWERVRTVITATDAISITLTITVILITAIGHALSIDIQWVVAATGVAACLLCFGISFFISKLPPARNGRWTCTAGLALIIILASPALIDIIRHYSFVGYFLTLAPLCAFFGGDFGDMIRRRHESEREDETMRREHEEAEAAYRSELEPPNAPDRK